MFGNNSTAQDIAKSLLEIKAIKLSPDEPFTWASGWKSPIYCDNRLTLSIPELCEKIKSLLSILILEKFGSVKQIAGVATAGIPQGALVANQLWMPFCYVRSKAKGHGRQNQIEGSLIEGADVVVVEDLISTGGSTIQAVEVLRAAGANVIGAVAIFTYGFPQSVDNFAKIDCPFYTLSNYEAMLPIAKEMGYISDEQFPILQSWRSAPSEWMQEA